MGKALSLRDIQKSTPIGVLFLLYNGGYPINFDRQQNATPDEDIVLTRCLLYIAAMQAVNFLDSSKKNYIYDLDVEAQVKLLKKWLVYKKELGQKIDITEEMIPKIVESVSYSQGLRTETIWQD